MNGMQFHSPGMHNLQNMQNSGLQRNMALGGMQGKQVDAPYKGLGAGMINNPMGSIQAKNSFGNDKDLHFGGMMMGQNKPGGPLAGGFPNLMTSAGIIGSDPTLQLGQ